MRKGIVIALASAMLAAAVLLVAHPTGAVAADGISLSRDGESWAAELPAPLFSDQVRWVPGDSRTEDVLVRNDSGDSARMHIDLVSGADDELLRGGDLEIATRIDGGEWTTANGPGAHELSEAGIGPGGVRTVEVRVALPWSSPNLTQEMTLDFDLRVTLVGSEASDESILSATGGTPDPPLIGSAVVAITGGALLLASRRRRSATIQEQSHE